MNDTHRIHQVISLLTSSRDALNSAVDALAIRVTTMTAAAEDTVANLSDSMAQAEAARAAFGTCQKKVDTIADTLRSWQADASEIALDTTEWNLRAKETLHELGVVIDERDTAHRHLMHWHELAVEHTEALARWRTPPASVESALLAFDEIVDKLRPLDPRIAGDLATSVVGTRRKMHTEVRRTVTQIANVRRSANLLVGRLGHAGSRVTALRRKGVAGHAELTEAVHTLEQFSGDVSQISTRVDDFDAAVDELDPLVRELSAKLDTRSTDKTRTRDRLSKTATRMAEQREMLSRSASLVLSSIRETLTELELVIKSPSPLMAAFDNAIDGSFALADRAGRAVVDRSSALADRAIDAIPEHWKIAVVQAGDEMIDHWDAVTFHVREGYQRVRHKLPTFIVTKLDHRRARLNGSLPDEVVIDEMNAGWRRGKR